MPLAGALTRAGLPVAVVNPVSAKYFARRRLQRTKSDPADARTLAALGMADEPRTFDPLASVDIRQAARFAMRLVEDQSRVLNRIQRLIDLGFPELGQVYDDPTCVSALAVLRVAPTALVAARKHPETLAKAERPGGGRPIGLAKATELIALAKQTIAPIERENQVRFEMQTLIEQHDLLERQIDGAESRVRMLLDGELARRLQTIPGVGPASAATLIAEIGDITALWRLRPARRVCRRAPGGKELRPEGWARDELGDVQDRQRIPARGALSHGPRRPAAQPGDPRPLRAQTRRGQDEDERPWPLHEEGARARLGYLARRARLHTGTTPTLDVGIWDLGRHAVVGRIRESVEVMLVQPVTPKIGRVNSEPPRMRIGHRPCRNFAARVGAIAPQ